MTVEVAAMTATGLISLAAGLILARPRFLAAEGAGKVMVLGPVFEAAALATFAAEHFTAARDLAPIVPHWLPSPLFWVYFFGVCLLAAAVSLLIWRGVRPAMLLLALFFLLVVATLDVPLIPKHLHERLFWSLFVREIGFASGAMVLAGSLWPRGRAAGRTLVGVGRSLLAAILIFYGIEHFLFPHFAPGVPLEKMTPGWVPVPVLWAYLVGIALLLGGLGLLARPTVRLAAAGLGIVVLLVTIFLYVPILVLEFHTPANAVDGLNYVYDTLLFAATVLLAGYGADRRTPDAV